MRTIIFSYFSTLLIAGCIGNTQSLSDTTQTIHPEASGTPNSEQQGKAFTISTEAFYQASLNSPTSPGRVISLSLTPNRKVEMRTDFLDKSQVLLDTGEWTTLNNGNLQLNLRRIGGKDTILLEFKTEGEKLVYRGSDYGPAGLILWVKPLAQ
jgi:hypothetical protein